MDPTPFPDGAAFREWLELNHSTAREVFVLFYKKGSGKPTISYKEALDEALCFGWIDGILRGVDAESYSLRFTPRRQGSKWSRVNVARAQELIDQGRMRSSGLEEFEKRIPTEYAHEQESVEFSSGFQERFESQRAAWDFFSRQTATYRRRLTHWVMSAKQASTRERRLEKLISASARGEQL